jgi:hypothetical protein
LNFGRKFFVFSSRSSKILWFIFKRMWSSSFSVYNTSTTFFDVIFCFEKLKHHLLAVFFCFKKNWCVSDNLKFQTKVSFIFSWCSWRDFTLCEVFNLKVCLLKVANVCVTFNASKEMNLWDNIHAESNQK